MIGLLILKNWKLLLNIAIVLAIIFLIFLWNPFNIFGRGLKLQDTANMVSEIREIGELITAEYYGEVIATDQLHEIEIEEPDYFLNQATSYYQELKNSMFSTYITRMDDAEASVEEIRNERRRARKLAARVAELRTEIVNDFADNWYKQDAYDRIGLNRDIGLSMLLFVASYEHSLNTNVKKFVKKDLKSKEGYVTGVIREVISEEYDNIRKYADGYVTYADYLNQGFTATASFRDFHYDYLESTETKKERRKQLALIGRGSVKAGFRFGELTDANFVYDDNRQVVHFFGFKAEILNQDINPWFIPERKVPGFDILLAEGKIDFEDMKAMKSKCIKVLRHNAEKAGIIEQAHTNGEEAMKEFFSLILDKEIKYVVFHQDMLTFRSDEILTDNLIDAAELDLIESLYWRNLQAIDREDNPAIKQRRERLLNKFLLELKEADSVEGIAGRKMFNFFNRHIPSLLADSMLIGPEEDWQVLQELRHNPATICTSSNGTDSACYVPLPANWMYWFKDSLEYISEYNNFIKYLDPAKGYSLGYFDATPLETMTIEYEDQTAKDIADAIEKKRIEIKDREKNAFRDSISFVFQDDEVYYYTLVKQVMQDSLSYLLKPGAVGHSVWKDLVESDERHNWDSTEFTDGLFVTRQLDYTMDDYVGILGRDSVEKSALLSYFQARNSAYHDIGPIMKARRQFDEFIREDSTMSNSVKAVKKWAVDVRKRVGKI